MGWIQKDLIQWVMGIKMITIGLCCLLFKIPPLPKGMMMSGWHDLNADDKKQMWNDYVKANPDYEAELLGENS